MKTNSTKDFFNILDAEGLTGEYLTQLAFDSEFQKRKSKKIESKDFLATMCIESIKGSPSCNDIASKHQSNCNHIASKQSISKKINAHCEQYFKTILEHLILSKNTTVVNEILSNNCKYRRVLIQDSTIIKLPLKLFNIFSGVSNGASTVCNARVQGVYDLISGTFIYFSIDSYSKNDISASSELALKKGDLTLRDRGYFTNAEIRRHMGDNADFIYRYKSKTTLLNSNSNKEIDLLKLLKSKRIIDMEVCLNDKDFTKVRLVAMPVSDEIASQRRMKAKKETRGHNPSSLVLELMGWTIFITSICRIDADFKRLLEIYGLRWRIEIIFKSWKSHIRFDSFHNVSANQLRIILFARFIMIVIFVHVLYNPWSARIRKKFRRELSLLKFLKYLTKNLEKCVNLLSIYHNTEKQLLNETDKFMINYCCYDKRKRLNFNQLFIDCLI